MYYRNCPETPYLHQGKLSLTFEGKLRVLLLEVGTTKICSKRPNGVEENAFFVVDRSKLKSAKDWLTTYTGDQARACLLSFKMKLWKLKLGVGKRVVCR